MLVLVELVFGLLLSCPWACWSDVPPPLWVLSDDDPLAPAVVATDVSAIEVERTATPLTPETLRPRYADVSGSITLMPIAAPTATLLPPAAASAVTVEMPS